MLAKRDSLLVRFITRLTPACLVSVEAVRSGTDTTTLARVSLTSPFKRGVFHAIPNTFKE